MVQSLPRTDETLLAELTVSRSVAFQWFAVGLAGTLISALLFSVVFSLVTGRTEFALGFSTDSVGTGIVRVVTGFALAMALLLVPIPVHEWIHGLAMRRYGGRPRYGVGLAHYVLPYAYATTEESFTRNQFVVVALAPLVAISLAGVALMAVVPTPWLVVPLAANAGGAVGDLWMTATLLRYPSTVRVEDHVSGMRIYGPASARREGSSPLRLARNAVVAFGLSLGVVLVAMLVAPLALSMLGVESLTLGLPDSQWYLFRFETSSSGEFGASARFDVAIALAAVVGLFGGLLSSTRGRRETA